MRKKPEPYVRAQYPTIKAPPHHGHIGCAVLNAALLPEEVYVMPICKLAQEDILGSRTRRCRLWRESHLADKRNSQMIDCSLHNNTNSLLVKADHRSVFLYFFSLKDRTRWLANIPRHASSLVPVFYLVSSSATSSGLDGPGLHEVFVYVGAFVQRSVFLETALQSPDVVLHLRENRRLQIH